MKVFGFAVLAIAPVIVFASREFGYASHRIDDADIQIGETLYGEYCAACHGKNLEGQPNWQIPLDDGTMPAPPHDASGHTWHHGNDQLFRYTLLGGEMALAEQGISNFKSGMPGFAEELSEQEIWNILAFIRSTWPERIQDIQASRSRPHN